MAKKKRKRKAPRPAPAVDPWQDAIERAMRLHAVYVPPRKVKARRRIRKKARKRA